MNVTDTSLGIYLALLILMEVLSVLASLVSLQLIVFHCYLACKKITTYEYILKQRGRQNQYKVNSIQMINENEGIQEVPLEEVYEPYMSNPQFKHDETQNEIPSSTAKVVPTKTFQEFHKDLNNSSDL